MRNYLVVLILSVLVFACGNGGSDENPEEITYPENEGNFITMIASLDAEGDTTSKLYLNRQGAVFTGYSRFDRNTSGAFELFQQVQFTFDNRQRLISAEFYDDNDRSQPAEGKMEYEWFEDTYTFKNLIYNNGSYELNAPMTTHFYRNPPNGYRLVQNSASDEYLFVYEEGNHVGFAYLNDNGAVDFDGRKWEVRRDFGFDDQPNALMDPTVDFMLGGRNLQRSMNFNNYNQYFYPGSSRVDEWLFTYGADKFREIEYEDGTKIVVSYVPIDD